MDEQWYSKLFKIYFPADEYIHIKMKIMVEFENITFESFLSKAVAAVSLYEKKMMTLTEVRNMLKLPPLQPEEAAELGLNTQTLVDPLTQSPPDTPNLVQSLMTQQKEATQRASGLGAGNSLTTAKTDLLNEGM